MTHCYRDKEDSLIETIGCGLMFVLLIAAAIFC